MRRQVAVALEYDAKRDRAPKVSAKGRGKGAERILEIARAHGVAVREDADLAEALAAIDVGEWIPEELYQAVAEVLAFVYRLNEKAKA